MCVCECVHARSSVKESKKTGQEKEAREEQERGECVWVVCSAESGNIGCVLSKTRD